VSQLNRIIQDAKDQPYKGYLKTDADEARQELAKIEAVRAKPRTMPAAAQETKAPETAATPLPAPSDKITERARQLEPGIDKAAHLSPEQKAEYKRQLHAAQDRGEQNRVIEAAQSDTSGDPELTKHEAAIRAIIARDMKEPEKVTPEEIDAVLKPLESLPKEQLSALSKKITGTGGRSAQDSLQRIRADMTAVRRLLESQRV
jgi:hypothetical protein